jgi:hypothetical protein
VNPASLRATPGGSPSRRDLASRRCLAAHAPERAPASASDLSRRPRGGAAPTWRRGATPNTPELPAHMQTKAPVGRSWHRLASRHATVNPR